ncbi:hypothetical protein GCM10011390_27280 [Aureimonas endophytica]|uniref:Tail specific protease domain-containing protein n=1 Tax=Aureimonas endophytica TaxID=2027858 RepID=A0A917E647_9HYPH|nr:hypothetical protein GCM10011390_27280 [Aureimonas endophytica]
MPFRDNGRARLFGEATAASSGQPYHMDLGDGLRFRVGAKRQFRPDGAAFEGVGLEPDETLSPTAEDIREGRDPVLRHALAWIAASGPPC